jgi:hypothetical protein
MLESPKAIEPPQTMVRPCRKLDPVALLNR